jgi:hypothetical protein
VSSVLASTDIATVAIPKNKYGKLTFDSAALLFENLEQFNTTELQEPQNMEPLGQGYGYILYSAHVNVNATATGSMRPFLGPAAAKETGEKAGQLLLTAPGLADRGLVYVEQSLQGIIGTWVPSHSLQLNTTKVTVKQKQQPLVGASIDLDILVSNEGRQSGELVSLAKNAKGILGTQLAQPVTVGSTRLHAMRATHLTLPEPATAWATQLKWAQPALAAAAAGLAPAFWKATLTATGPEATFLVTDGWGHGVVFVNGVNVGKFTCLGPGRSLYVPTGVLHAGANTVIAFETDQVGLQIPDGSGGGGRTMESVTIGPLWVNSSVRADASTTAPLRHEFWGMSGDGDLTPPPSWPDNATWPNNCTACFAAGNFIRSAPASILTQPSCKVPKPSPGCPTCKPPIPPSKGFRPLPKIGSKAMNRTLEILHAAPPGRRTLSFDGGAPCGNHHPADNLFAQLNDVGTTACKTPTGLPMNFSGLWWDHGVAQIAVDWADSLAHLQSAGAPTVDVLTIDTECDVDAFTVTSWQRAYHPEISVECEAQHFDSIQNDHRFPAVLQLLQDHGFIVNGSTSSTHWLRDSLIWDATKNFNQNLAAWSAVSRKMIADYKNQAYFKPMIAVNPDVVVSDYDDVTWRTDACSLDLNGFWQNGCNHANNTDGVMGNRQAPDFYGWMHNVTDNLNFPGLQQTISQADPQVTSFGVTPFDSLLWSVYLMRMYRLSSPILVKPWIAYRSYAGDGGVGDPVVGWANTDLYQELVLHLGLQGADDFLLFNPCFGTCTQNQNTSAGAQPMCTLADNEMYSQLFTELSAIVGYQERQWIEEPTPGGWGCKHLLTAMTTPVSRVWRFTPADGAPHSHLTQTGHEVTLVLPHAGSAAAPLVFEQASIVSAATGGNPVSVSGLWINQSLSAPLPQGWQCRAKTDDDQHDAEQSPILQTTCGPARGVMDGAGVVAYKGVPYAAPPTGTRRWKQPLPLEGEFCWNGTLNATDWATACAQYGGPQPSTGSEDCLTLNIWSPLTASRGAAREKLLPIHVFLYGGDLTQGKTAWYNMSACVKPPTTRESNRCVGSKDRAVLVYCAV